MDANFRFGLWERLAVVALIASLAGVVVSVTYPLAYPTSVISVETWRIVLWTSTFVLGGAVLFFICDLGLKIAVQRGVQLGTALASIGTILIVIGAIVGLVGAFHIDAEKNVGSGDPLIIHGYTVPYDPVDGVVVSGIKWHQGYAHSVIVLSNSTTKNILNLDVLIKPDFPIIRSIATSDFAQCRIGSAFHVPKPFIIGDNSKIVASDGPDDDGNYEITPIHRLVCDKLPAHTDIQVILATVDIGATPTLTEMFRKERQDVKLLLFQISYEIDGQPYRYDAQLPMAPP